MFWTGYGFVDFNSPAAAQAAIKSLTESGILAQMAKVNSKVMNPIAISLI